MSKLIALRSGYEDHLFNAQQQGFLSLLKQQSLLFDKIGILRLDEVLNYPNFPVSNNDDGKFLRLEIEWLKENKVIFNLEPMVGQDFINTDAGQYLFKKLKEKDKERIKLHKKLADKAFRKEIDDLSIEDVKDLIQAAISKNEFDAQLLRIISLNFEFSQNITAVTILSFFDYVANIPNAKKSDVVQIVVNNLPLPNNETSWEQIIDYRSDPDTQNKLLALRRWIRRASTQNLSRNEIEEEIEWLINEFQRHMKFHKMKANTETLEVLVKVPFEILENLLKLKLSKIPEPFFAIKKRQLMLMEAEINAPGKELSYIIKSREAFQSEE